MEGRRPGLRRLPTRNNQFSRPESSKLHDLFKVDPDDDAVDTTPTSEVRSLSTTARSTSDRTLFDVVREEKDLNGVLVGSSSDGTARHINWKVFRDRLRLRRACAAFASSTSHRTPRRSTSLRPGSPRPALSSATRPSMRVNSSASKKEGEEEKKAREGEEEAGEADVIYPWQKPVSKKEGMTMSLMALLEQSDMMDGLEEDYEGEGMGDEEEEEEEEEEEDEEETMESECCICMVKHRGSAFKACGHSFCRLCSRELWVESGTCPLCDGFILEILHVF